MLLEPDIEEDVGPGDLPVPYGLATEPGAHERYRTRFDGGADRGFIFMNSHGRPNSSKKRSQIYVVARNAGILSKLPGSAKPVYAEGRTWAPRWRLRVDAETSVDPPSRLVLRSSCPRLRQGTRRAAVIAMDADIGDLADPSGICSGL